MSLRDTRGVDPHPEMLLVGRRSFLGSIGMMAGAVMATSLVPLSTVHAIAQLPVSAASRGAVEGTWHVDDICGHWPRYSHPIGYSSAPGAHDSLLAHADPIDHVFLS
jgi:hypothetical protein